jgi:uncharacterized membrane protein (UPF0127 family)
LRCSLLALTATLAFAPAAMAEIPRQDPAHCKGQPELKPLEPLEVRTSKGSAKFMVEFAGTDMTREYGLMCRKSLAPDRGMLFDFGQPLDGAAFWMRNTLIPLDIIYIKDGTVLSIARNVPPLDESPVQAGGRIRTVLEIPAGRAAQLGIMPGDRVLHRVLPHG